MRILGQIPHPELIIQVFKSGNKFILKFEAGPFEQSYKFMETERLSSFEDFKTIVTEELIREIYSIFDQMNTRYILISSKL
jgi:hypothetical protein